MTRPLACPACALPYKPEDVHLDERVAVCRACDQVFPITQRRRSELPRQAGWERGEEGGGLVLRHRWLGWHVLFLVAWCALWNGGLLSALGQGAVPALLLLHAIVGVGVLYFTLCSFVNTSTITVRGGRLTLAHGPLPWPGGITLATGDIDQLYVEETYSNKRRHWHVLALCSDGVARKVSPQLTSRDQGRWVEQQIEAHLGIHDRPVAAEA